MRPREAVAANLAQLVERASQSRFSRRNTSKDVPQYISELEIAGRPPEGVQARILDPHSP